MNLLKYMLNTFIFLEISKTITNSECVIVTDEKTPPANITLPNINAFEVNNEIDNDDSPVNKMSDLTNTALISEGMYLIYGCLNICPFLPALAYFKYILKKR